MFQQRAGVPTGDRQDSFSLEHPETEGMDRARLYQLGPGRSQVGKLLDEVIRSRSCEGEKQNLAGLAHSGFNQPRNPPQQAVCRLASTWTSQYAYAARI